jgi:ATP-binding cassette, subfamily F, member 3
MAGTLGSQPTRDQDLRAFLGMFNFGGDMVKQSVGSMSGGEKARLVLCMIVWQRPNLLLLDEPTNHLDLATREALSMALNEFEGTVMLVSHDRALLRAVCDEFWMVSQGGVTPFDGDLDDYQKYLLDYAKQQRDEAKKSGKNGAAATAVVAAKVDEKVAAKVVAKPIVNNAITKPLRKSLEKIEDSIAALTKELDAIQAELLVNSNVKELAEKGKRLNVVESELSALEERWLEVTDQIDSVTQ